MKILIFLIFFVTFFSTLCFAYQEKLIELSENDIKSGVVLDIDGNPFFLKDPEKKGGDTFDIKPEGVDYKIKVTIKQDTLKNGKNVLIPVEITDVKLAQGAQINLRTPDGKIKVIRMPPKKVFLPYHFFYMVPDAGEVGKGGGKNGNLVLEVAPKLTTKVKVDVQNTADDGVVVTLDYMTLSMGRFKDVTNRVNRREIDAKIGYPLSEESVIGVSSENILETYKTKRTDLFGLNKLSDDFRLYSKYDNLQGVAEKAWGENLIYVTNNMDKDITKERLDEEEYKRFVQHEFEVGNITARVDEDFHTQYKFSSWSKELTLRFEGITSHRVDEGDWDLPVITAERFGGQLTFYDIIPDFDLTIGRLNLQRDNDLYGRIEKKNFFTLDYRRILGPQYARLLEKFPCIDGDIDMRATGEGKEIWLRSVEDINVNFSRNTTLRFRITDDYITLGGTKKREPWQNRGITLIKYRDLFGVRNWLSRFNLEYGFISYETDRTGYSSKFSETIKAGIGKNLKISKYDIPLEFFLERDKKGRILFNWSISLKQWI